MPNVDAMICRVNLYLGNDGEVSQRIENAAGLISRTGGVDLFG